MNMKDGIGGGEDFREFVGSRQQSCFRHTNMELLNHTLLRICLLLPLLLLLLLLTLCLARTATRKEDTRRYSKIDDPKAVML